MKQKEKKSVNRYHQRRQKRLQNPKIAAGYQEMSVELDLARALDAALEQRNIPLLYEVKPNHPRKG